MCPNYPAQHLGLDESSPISGGVIIYLEVERTLFLSPEAKNDKMMSGMHHPAGHP